MSDKKTWIKAYKGFDKDLKCRDFQYEIGKTYEEPTAELCNSGFHACEYPLDVFAYYAPGDMSRYCEVDLDDVSDKKGNDDSKRCGKKIAVKAEIGIAGLVKASVDFVMENIKDEKKASTNTGDYSASTNTGSRSGAEVVQLYVSQRNPTVVRPKKELKAFRRVELAPGKSREVEFELDRSALAYWDDQTHGWRVDPGEYVLSLGTSSADIAVELPVSVE